MVTQHTSAAPVQQALGLEQFLMEPTEWPCVRQHCFDGVTGAQLGRPTQAFPPLIFLDKNRRDIGKSQSTWTAS
eukprot:COSAG01_NODE_1173_length_11400_cov_2.767366_7_plen_74_part_00